MPNPVIFELHKQGRSAEHLPLPAGPESEILASIPERMRRRAPLPLPEVPELELARHYERLARMNHHVEKDVYPLGSCTMKYNPKLHEKVASLPGFAALHPMTPEELSQGALELLVSLEEALKAITGMDAFTLQPSAGAHGEFTGLSLVEAYYRRKGETRPKVVLPDSAHGTNPASVRRLGLVPVEVKSDERGEVSLEALERIVDGSTAALMLTLPNTLGLFESRLPRIVEIVHGAGAQIYLDGANLNALLGIVRPGDVGFDVMHTNLHKTFSTPHGGGGPGAGPVGVKEHLRPFLPTPRAVRSGDRFAWDHDCPDSIGPVHSWYGNFAILVRAYAYIRHLGAPGLREVTENAILNANYLRSLIEKEYPIPYRRIAMHEFVASASRFFKDSNVRAMDIGKRLLDFGFYAPTISFPLIVKEALMIEPTETETRESIERYAEAMLRIAREIEEDPERVRSAPHETPVRRVNESLASRRPRLAWEETADGGGEPPRD
ncbi:MAG: glycine dehydrogenase subunit 2 [Candidatus Latescibacterota bacterium]|nr:MAG: glycine dehydrogenase subunit 2 [Candidatus Latescibacterota bacterium]